MPVVKEGKTLIEALENAKNELRTEKIYYTVEENKKEYIVKAISYQEILIEIETYLKKVIEGLGIEVKLESNIVEDQFYITMYSENNNILIGRNGATLKALETLSRVKVHNDWKVSPKIILDVENYREKRIEALERLAVQTAKEVKLTKIAVTLENMNSFERRVIHNKLSNFKGVITSSEGIEPHRHVVIKAE